MKLEKRSKYFAMRRATIWTKDTISELMKERPQDELEYEVKYELIRILGTISDDLHKRLDNANREYQEELERWKKGEL